MKVYVYGRNELLNKVNFLYYNFQNGNQSISSGSFSSPTYGNSVSYWLQYDFPDDKENAWELADITIYHEPDTFIIRPSYSSSMSNDEKVQFLKAIQVTIDGTIAKGTVLDDYSFSAPITKDAGIMYIWFNAPQGVTVTPTLTNCTIYPTTTTFDVGSTVTFTVTATGGYYFSSVPTIGSESMKKVTNSIYSLTTTLSSDVTITASARKKSRFNVTNNMKSATISPNNQWYTTYGEKQSFTVSASDYTQFTIPPTINGLPMTLGYDKTYADYDNFEITDDIVFEGKTDYSAITYYTATVTSSNCTITPQATEFYDGQTITYIVYANDGYSFYSTPTINGTEMTKISDTAYTATITPTSDFTVIANAEKPKVYHTVTYNLSNCTITPQDEQVVEGEEYTFTVKANDNYRFTTAPTLNDESFNKVSDYEYTITTTITDNITITAKATEIPLVSIYYNLSNATGTPTAQQRLGTTVTITVTANSGYKFDTAPTVEDIAMTKVNDYQYTYTTVISNNLHVSGSAVYIPKTYSLTTNLDNCSISPTTTTFEEKTTQTFTITANDGYHFTESPIITPTSSGTISKVSDTEYQVSITFTGDVIVDASAIELPKAIFTYKTLTNCTCNYNSGDILDATKAIIFTANDGYYFDNYVVSWISSTGLYLHSTLNGTSSVLLDENTVKSYVEARESITIDSVTAIIQNIDIVNGVNIYEITNDELVDLMNNRFVVEQDNTRNDFGKYITNLYVMPFSLDDIIGDSTNIVLGYQSSSTTGHRLRKSSIDISVGDITIPNYENAYEANASYRLFLPFIREIIDLSTEFIVNHTLSIEYHIDFIEETVTVKITNESLELPFFYQKYTCGRNLPFFNTENGNTNLQYSDDTINNTLYAYIIKTVNTAYNDNSEIGKNTHIYDTISNYEGGYIECTNAKVEDSKITKQEKEELDSILRNGVYINGIS